MLLKNHTPISCSSLISFLNMLSNMNKSLSIPHLLTLLLFNSTFVKGNTPSNTTAVLLVPATPIEYRALGAAELATNMMTNDPFQLCLDCRCCAAADPTDCSPMSCCFGIDCNLPDKPYGVCAFVPQACNCTSCAS